MASVEEMNVLAQFLDKHLVLLLLQHVKLSDPRPRLELLSKTKMIDFAREEYEKEKVRNTTKTKKKKKKKEKKEWSSQKQSVVCRLLCLRV